VSASRHIYFHTAGCGSIQMGLFGSIWQMVTSGWSITETLSPCQY